MNKILTISAFLLAGLLSAQAKDYKLSSPSGNLSIVVSEGKTLSWSVSCDGRTLLEPSEIALEIKGKGVLGPGAKARKLSRRTVD